MGTHRNHQEPTGTDRKQQGLKGTIIKVQIAKVGPNKVIVCGVVTTRITLTAAGPF